LQFLVSLAVNMKQRPVAPPPPPRRFSRLPAVAPADSKA